MLGRMYSDKFDIYRMVDAVGADKITRQSRSPVQSGVPGQLSLSSADKTGGPAEAANDIKTDYILLCDPATDIRAGDEIIVRGLSCLAGLSHKYPASHQQVPLEYKGEA